MRTRDQLRPYQQRIATHLYEHDEAFCIVRPGGGKTISALTAIGELLEDKVIRHALVIAPKRVATSVWPEEIESWEHVTELNYAILDGTAAYRSETLRIVTAHRKADVTMIGIDNVKWLLEELERVPHSHPIFDLLVIDEISKLRDPTGVRAKLLAKHANNWRMIWGLSGTLHPNSAQDLFMPARVVTRGKLWGRSFYQWRRERFYPTDYNGYNWEPLPGEEVQIYAEIAPYTVTLRDDEMPQLPELSVQLDYVTLPDKARLAYHTMHTKLVAKQADKTVLAANAAVATGKLAQIANGFMYQSDKEDIEASATALQVHDEKRTWLRDTLEQIGGPVIVVYQYLEDMRMIHEICGDGVPYLGANVSDKEAATAIREWNEGKVPVLALHPAAGGHGLNLQHGGSDMLWIAPTWSPEYWEQTIARIHRSGQTRPVIVRVCIATGTVDELKLARVHHKMSAQQAFEHYLQTYDLEMG